MNREIKFRGKRLDNGEFVYGSLIVEPHRVRIFVPHDDRSSSLHEVDHKTVGQYTGHKGKSVEEIYEGDVITDEYHKWEKEIVEWKEDHYSPYSTGQSCDCCNDWGSQYTSWNKAEIIGNIYENPELLTKKTT